MFKKGWLGISACARGKEIPGDLAGRFGRGCAAGRKERGKGAADGWARGRSEMGRVLCGLLREQERGADRGAGWAGGAAGRAVRENWLGQCAEPKREKERAD